MSIASLLAASADLDSVAQGPDLTRYFMVCAGVLLLVVLLAWVFRRFVSESLRRKAAKRSLSVADVLPLGGKQKLIVVRCYDRSFLLGLGDKEITSIAELDAESAPESAPDIREEEPKIVEPFTVTLAEELQKPQPLRRTDRRRLERWKEGEGVVG